MVALVSVETVLLVLLFAALTVSGGVLATPAAAVDAPIGRLGTHCGWSWRASSPT